MQLSKVVKFIESTWLKWLVHTYNSGYKELCEGEKEELFNGIEFQIFKMK